MVLSCNIVVSTHPEGASRIPSEATRRKRKPKESAADA